MVVDGTGNAYVGDFGYDLRGRCGAAAGVLVLVPVDGRTMRRGRRPPLPERLRDHTGWNDARRRRVGGQPAHRVRRGGRRQPDGRRVFADLGDVVPDGIALDAEGAVWVADPLHNAVVRVADGGEVLERIATSQGAFACELGGHDGRTLYVCTYDAAASASPTPTAVGRVEATTVDVPAPA